MMTDVSSVKMARIAPRASIRTAESVVNLPGEAISSAGRDEVVVYSLRFRPLHQADQQHLVTA